MVLKVVRAMEFLEVMNEPRDIDLLKVAEKVPCHLRTVRRAKVLLKERQGRVTITVAKIEQLTSNALYLQWFMNTHCVLKTEMKAVWKRKLLEVDKGIKILQVELGLDEKGVRIPEDG